LIERAREFVLMCVESCGKRDGKERRCSSL